MEKYLKALDLKNSDKISKKFCEELNRTATISDKVKYVELSFDINDEFYKMSKKIREAILIYLTYTIINIKKYNAKKLEKCKKIIENLAINTEIKEFMNLNINLEQHVSEILQIFFYIGCQDDYYILIEYIFDNMKYTSPRKLLTVAIKNNKIKIAKKLLEYDIDVNFRIIDSPLEIAFRIGNEELVRLLINKGAHITANCFYNAIETSKFNLIKFLVEKGVNINSDNGLAMRKTLDNWRYNARDSNSILIYLFEHGGDMHINNDYIMNNAISLGNVEIVEYIALRSFDRLLIYIAYAKQQRRIAIKEKLEKIYKELSTKLTMTGLYQENSAIVDFGNNWLYDWRMWRRISEFI